VQHFVKQCLQSVKGACKNHSHEIIVVDNNSSDTSCAMILEEFPDIQMISNSSNIGFSKANNQGVCLAKGEYILILNPDIIVAEDSIDKVIDFADKQINLGAVGVRMIDGIGDFLPESKRNVPTIRVANQKIRGIAKNYYAIQFEENDTAKIDILTGAFLLMKRQVFLNVGGFDEDYFMYGEDVDLCYKLLKNGYDNFYLGETTILHYKGESTKKDILYLQNFYGAMQLFYAKHFKVNSWMKFFSKAVFKTLISYKFLTLKKGTKTVCKTHKFVYVGNNRLIFEKLVRVEHAEEFEMCDSVPENIDFDKIFFDADYLSFKKIIFEIQKSELRGISKRMIPKNSSFYIGSDSSITRGEVREF